MGRALGLLLPAALALLLRAYCSEAVALSQRWALEDRGQHLGGEHGGEHGGGAQVQVQAEGQRTSVRAGMRAWLSSWLDGTRTQWLTLPGLELAQGQTAVVTHAGKNDQEFIDMAVMLGVSLQRHLPGYPRIAMAIEGMTDANKDALRNAGWQILMVEDLVPSSAAAERDKNFFFRWGDVLEKLNMFRIQASRVLFLDADTYVVSGKLGFLLNSTDLPAGNIAMAPDGCKEESNSGVMLFRPDLDVFHSMLEIAAGIMDGNATMTHDQPIINSVFKGKVTPLDKQYNCLNPTGRVGIAECLQGCKDPVVAHFTGLPKPARADMDFLDIIRRPAAPLTNCMGTNHGSCEAWSDFYCDLHGSKSLLTAKLQKKLDKVGGCCQKPWKEGDPAECATECPTQLRLKSTRESIQGVFNQTNIKSSASYNGGRPIYIGPDKKYLWYVKHRTGWVVGDNYQTDAGYTYAHSRGLCPTEPMAWKTWSDDTKNWVKGKTSVFGMKEENRGWRFDPVLVGGWVRDDPASAQL